MPAKVAKVTTASVREAAEHHKRLAKAKESAEVRAEVAEEQNPGSGPAFFRLVGKAKKAVSRATAGPSSEGGHVYSEWMSGAKVAGIAAYDKALTGGDHSHCAKLHQSRDIDTAVRELTGGMGGVQNPLLGLVLTTASISTLHRLSSGVEHPVDRPAVPVEPVVS